MKYALITPEVRRESGFMVADVAQQSFEVCEPFFWVECADEVTPEGYWYDSESKSFERIPEPEPVSQPSSTGAQTL